MLRVYGHYKYINRLYTSESDVNRRQILAYKDDPRAEKVDVCLFVERYAPNGSS